MKINSNYMLITAGIQSRNMFPPQIHQIKLLDKVYIVLN